MKKYSVMLRGENYLIRVNGQPQKCGFFATRIVKSLNSQEAFEIAANFIRRELHNTVLNTAEDSPLIYVEELTELKQFERKHTPGRGFVWFNDDDEKQQ